MSDLRNNRDNCEITVGDFVRQAPKELELAVIAGSSGINDRYIVSDRVQKLGLAFAGFHDYIHRGRIQMIGKSEIEFLDTLTESDQTNAINALIADKIVCVLASRSIIPPDSIKDFCEANSIPLLSTPLVGSRAIGLVTEFLQQTLAPQTTIHGVLMEMFGIGVFITGRSGIGKSESALDLLTQKYRLIADDAVHIKRVGKRLIGSAPELTRGLLEIRGLGVINVHDLFGGNAVSNGADISLCIRLIEWGETDNIERIGLEMDDFEVFEIKLPAFVLPVSPGRNLATLLETAVKVFLLKNNGIDAARDLIEKHNAMLSIDS